MAVGVTSLRSPEREGFKPDFASTALEDRRRGVGGGGEKIEISNSAENLVCKVTSNVSFEANGWPGWIGNV